MNFDLAGLLALAQNNGPLGWALAGLLVYLRWKSGQPILPVVPPPAPNPK